MIVKTSVLIAVCIAFAKANEELVKETDFIEYLNSAQNLWVAKENEITKNGIDYMTKILGTKLPENGVLLPVNDEVEILDNIPKSFDARKNWPKCPTIQEIKNQGNCGSCWAVAAASTASDRLCIKSGGKTKINLSAENLLSCCSDCSDEGGCEGGYPDKAWNYFQETGLVSGGDYGSREGCQPYEITPSHSEYDMFTPACHKKCTNEKYKKSYKKDKHYGKTSYSLPNSVTAIQSDIIKNGPVEAAFVVYRDFMYYTSGVYKKTSSQEMGGHAVRLIGWGTEDGVDYWLVANSWGENWGESGTFRIVRGTNECGFESYITAGIIKK